MSDLMRLFFNPHDTQPFLTSYQGPVGGDFNSHFYLTDQEAKEMFVAFHELYRRYSFKTLPVLGTKRYYVSVTFLPLES